MATTRSERAAVFYDGDCAFCRKSIALLKRLDWRGRLRFVNFRDPSNPLLKTPVLAQAPLVDEMHLLTPDGTRLYHGFGALRWLAWRIASVMAAGSAVLCSRSAHAGAETVPVGRAQPLSPRPLSWRGLHHTKKGSS